MKKIMLKFYILLVFFSSSLYAVPYYSVMQKYEAKSDSQWTLSDWLNQKSKVSMMDFWLAMNRSATYFEAFAKGAVYQYDEDVSDKRHRSKVGSLGFFITIFGLEGHYEDSDNVSGVGLGERTFIKQKYMTHLRLLGVADQGTNLTATYGLRIFERSGEKFENYFYGGSLKIYLLSFLGMEGLYHRWMKNKSDLGTELEGYRAQYGLFLEIYFFQIYTQYFQEKSDLITEGSSVLSSEKNSGYEAGIKIYF